MRLRAPVRTKIHVVITPQYHRDRRSNIAQIRSEELFVSLRSYLMASEEETEASESAWVSARRILLPWRRK